MGTCIVSVSSTVFSSKPPLIIPASPSRISAYGVLHGCHRSKDGLMSSSESTEKGVSIEAPVGLSGFVIHCARAYWVDEQSLDA